MEAHVAWEFKDFFDLKNIELYEILKLRNEVFVLDQKCIYLDTDGLDTKAIHLCGYIESRLVAYCRIFPFGIKEEKSCNFGRVAVASNMRHKGFGKELIKRTQAFLKKEWPNDQTLIHAQNYLKAFYESLGFRPCSDVFNEEGIPHIKMIWKHQ